MGMFRKAVILIFILISGVSSFAQVNASDSAVAAFIPYASYAFQIPGGDVADRYGVNSTLGAGFFYKSKKNLLLSFDFNYIFGDQVKNADTILWMVETDDGYIIDGNGTYTNYALYERGYSINFRVGKIINALSPNPNSGILLMGGVGYLLHRMRIDNQNNTAPQISGDYAKGYDRLTGGINLNQFIGYYYMGKSKVLNFYGGFEFYQAFTKSRRDYIFDRMSKDNNNYIDLFFGFKVGWMIPIYKRAPDSYYYY
jgi:hypothetical protein